MFFGVLHVASHNIKRVKEIEREIMCFFCDNCFVLVTRNLTLNILHEIVKQKKPGALLGVIEWSVLLPENLLSAIFTN